MTKYAAASCVEVAVRKKEDTLLVMVSDDGCGFDTTQRRNGIGITNMQMRADHLGGTLVIDSAPGKGCRMEATFSLHSL